MPPTFSIVLTSYNHAEFVTSALNSILAQTFQDWELLVVDDGSTDGSVAVIQDWIANSRVPSSASIKFMTGRKGGQAAAIEAGMTIASGSHIALLDSDDRWLDRKLEEVASAITGHPGSGMITHPLWVITADGRRTERLRPRRARLSSGDVRDFAKATGRIVAPPTSGVVIRSDVLRELMPMPLAGFRSAADAYLTLAASLLAPVCALESPLGEYRVHEKGHFISRMATADGLRTQVALQEVIAGHLGLLHVERNNSFFARNRYALNRVEGGRIGSIQSWLTLLRATLADQSFTPWERAAFLSFWTLTMVAPLSWFLRAWRWFQRKQVGVS